MPPRLKKSIEYEEKPASDDEQKIASFLEAFLSALNKKEIRYLSVLIPDDISVIVDNGNSKKLILDKSGYLKIIIESINRVQAILYKNVLIRIDGLIALVYGNRTCFLKESIPQITSFVFQFKRNKESWNLSKLTLPKF